MKEFKRQFEKALALLPDWARGRKIMLLADQELVARRDPEGPLMVKVSRCDQSGECCLDIPQGHLDFGTNGEGRCNKLADDGSCTAGHQKPFGCLDDPPQSELDELNCPIRYI